MLRFHPTLLRLFWVANVLGLLLIARYLVRWFAQVYDIPF